MSKATLAIDFGASSSSAVLVNDGRERRIKDPATGSYSWPSSVFQEDGVLLACAAAEDRKLGAPDRYRAGFKSLLGSGNKVTLGDMQFDVGALVAAVLRRLREEAEADAEPIDRAVLTVPSSYGENDPSWAAMIDAGHEAGFSYVDLLWEPVAAALAPLAGGPFAAGDTVLVYDLGGGTFDAALVRFGADDSYQVLGHAAEANTGGREIDARLVAYVREHAGPELSAMLSPPAGKSSAAKQTALRAGLMAEDLVRTLKHRLSEQKEAEHYLTLQTPLTLTRAELEEQVKPLLDATVACCRGLLAAAGVTADDLAGILRVGGSSRLQAVQEVLSPFGAPLRRAEDPDLAVVEGAANWAARVPSRRLEPKAIESGHRPLRWQLPIGEAAELERWLVPEGELYTPGMALALVRLNDGSLWRLYDDATGPMLLDHVQGDQGGRIVSGDWLATVRAPAPRVLHTYDGEVDAVAFSRDGSTLATARSGQAYLLTVATGDQAEVPARDGHTTVVAGYPADDRVLLATSSQGKLTLWDAVTDDDVRSLDFDGVVFRAASDPGLSRIAVVFNETLTSVHLWPIGAKYPGDSVVLSHDATVYEFTFSRSGAECITASGDRTARIWDAATGEERLRVAHTSVVRAARLSPDGTRLLTGGDDNVARVWDASTGQELFQLAHPSYVYAVAFSPEGSRFATTSGQVVKIWDLATGQELLAVSSGGNPRAAVFKSAGTHLALATSAGAVELWPRLAPVLW